MPVKKFQLHQDPSHLALVEALTQEWSSPAENVSEPVILEQFDRGGLLNSVYVVWSRWQGVDLADRSEIIMDAAERYLGSLRATDITVAMGLEPSEAKKMGLEF